MNYQDKYVAGLVVESGERDCAERYEIVRKFCRNYTRPFTVLDLGANLCYFGVRLTEEFPDCTVAAIECAEVETAVHVLRANDATRVILLSKQVTLDDLRALAECEHFDLVLGLSVIHHFPGTFQERLEVFRSLGDHLILELACEDAACGGEQKSYALPQERRLLGYGKSHLAEGVQREIVLLSKPKIAIKKAYLGSERTDLFMAIYSDYSTKRVRFFNKPEAERDWLRGINLQTYLKWNGVWPEKKTIASQLAPQREEILRAHHGDVNPWNVVFAGDYSKFIDVNGPMEVVFEDAEYFDNLLAALAV